MGISDDRNGYANFTDHELLTRFLSYLVPELRAGAISQELLKKWGDLSNIIYCEKEKLFPSEDNNILESQIAGFFVTINELFTRGLRNKATQKEVISTSEDLIKYLQCSMAGLENEQLRVLFLNSKNYLIADEIVAVGTIDHLHAYPRDIVKKALLYNAKAIILAHNHPSGNVSPSNADIKITTRIVLACKTLDIKVHDHIIISREGHTSLRRYCQVS